MRMLRKNTQPLYYALYKENKPVYERDENGNIVYDDIDGSSVPRIAEYQNGYDEIEEFDGNIAFSGGEAEADIYGISISAYDCKLTMKKGAIPITETSLIFKESTPKYDSKGQLKEESADFHVVKVAESLNTVVYLLKRIVHGT